MTIASDEMGVTTRSSRVCFSRSRLIEPAVDAGARNTTWSVSSIKRAAKMPCPIDADARPAEPPKPELYVRSMISSTIHAKPPRRTR
jgi:hypothetical protein